MLPVNPSTDQGQESDRERGTAQAAPAFACVIPAYNREGTVARAIESALSQDPPPQEIIVVDDGSTDGTRAAVEKFGDQVTYLHQENAGAAAARNHGIRAATSEWVALLDSDDYWLPGHLARISDAIVGTQGAAILYFADSERPTAENSVTQWQRSNFEIKSPYELRKEASAWVIRARIPMMLQASVFHRERFLARGGLWSKLPMRDDTHAFLALGISEPLCAVANLGVRMTSDDQSGTRLTTAVGNKTCKYWHLSTLMWRDLIDRGQHLDKKQRALLRDRLAVSHMRFARHALRRGKVLTTVVNLARSIGASPGRFVKSLFWLVGCRIGDKPTG